MRGFVRRDYAREMGAVRVAGQRGQEGAEGMTRESGEHGTENASSCSGPNGEYACEGGCSWVGEDLCSAYTAVPT